MSEITKKLFLMLIIASGCSPIYVPNARNSPLFTKGGEFQGAASIGNGIELQTAVAVSNHIGLMANYSYQYRNGGLFNSDDSKDDYHYHQFVEGGLGYYTNRENWGFELYGGYGKGEGRSYDNYSWFSSTNQLSTGKYERYFIQPAFGFRKKKISVSFISRLSLVNFREFTDGVTTYKVTDSPDLFFEPAAIGRLNFANNRLIFTWQVGFSLNTGSSIVYDYRPLQASAGLGFRFGGISSQRSNNNSDH